MGRSRRVRCFANELRLKFLLGRRISDRVGRWKSLTKETVIIVHGTWAAPKDDPIETSPITLAGIKFLRRGSKSELCIQTQQALERRGSSARCWAHCKDNSDDLYLVWKKSWIDRIRAASSLAAEINKLQAIGWRCHVVAHSHGGNIVAESLPQLQALAKVAQSSDGPTALSGTIITLGTPFIDVISPIAARIVRRRKLRDLFASTVLLLFLVSGLWVIGVPELNGYYYPVDWIFFIGFIVVCVLAIIMLLRSRQRAGNRSTGINFGVPLQSVHLCSAFPVPWMKHGSFFTTYNK